MEEMLDSEEREESRATGPQGNQAGSVSLATYRPILGVFLRYWCLKSELSKSLDPGSQMYPVKQAPAHASVPNSCHTDWGRGHSLGTMCDCDVALYF